MSPVDFESDEDKAASNLKKHRVSFKEAASDFPDPLAPIFSMRHVVATRFNLSRAWSSQTANPLTSKGSWFHGP